MVAKIEKERRGIKYPYASELTFDCPLDTAPTEVLIMTAALDFYLESGRFTGSLSDISTAGKEIYHELARLGGFQP